MTWTRRFQRITLILDGTFTAQADLPGADSVFNMAQGPLVIVDIGGFPAGVLQAKGKSLLKNIAVIRSAMRRNISFCFVRIRLKATSNFLRGNVVV